MSAVTPVLRAFASSDLEQVLRLHAEVFGETASRALERRWAWSQVENLCPENSPKWVLEADGTVVGFLGTVPIPYRIEGKRVMTHSPCDYMVAAPYRFHGIKLLRECYRTCDFNVSLDDIPATIAVSKFLKAQQTGTMRRFDKVLDARLGLSSWPSLRALPPMVWDWARAGLALSDMPSMLRLPTINPYTGSFGASFDRLFERSLSADPLQATVERDSRYLNWRYGPKSPQAHRVVGIAEADGELAGYVVCCVSRDQGHRGFILELVTAPGAPTSLLDGLISFAVRELRRQDAWTMRWFLLGAEETQKRAHLRRWGFRRQNFTYELLSRLPEPPRGVWRQQFGDGELSHGSVL